MTEVAEASGREISYVPVSPEDYAAGAVAEGVPAEVATFLTSVFRDVLGNDAYVTDGVQRVLGRSPRDFADYAARTAAAGAWT